MPCSSLVQHSVPNIFAPGQVFWNFVLRLAKLCFLICQPHFLFCSNMFDYNKNSLSCYFQHESVQKFFRLVFRLFRQCHAVYEQICKIANDSIVCLACNYLYVVQLPISSQSNTEKTTKTCFFCFKKFSDYAKQIITDSVRLHSYYFN